MTARTTTVSYTRLTLSSVLQAKAAFGVKPASKQVRLGHRLVSHAEKKGADKKPQEDTKSENTEKVQKAERGGEKGSQIVEKVGNMLELGHALSLHGVKGLDVNCPLFCRRTARRTCYSLPPTSPFHTLTAHCLLTTGSTLWVYQTPRVLEVSSTQTGSDTVRSSTADGRP